MISVDGEPAQKRRRYERIARQLAGEISGKFDEFHAGRGQCIVAADGAVRQHENERRRNILAGVLAGLASYVAIERFGAADEGTAIVLRTKRLNPKRSPRSARHRSCAGGFAVPAHGVTQTIIDGFGIQERMDKRFAISN